MLVIGLMNGTSADGIDAALVEISGAPPRLRHKLLAFHCERLDPRVRAAVLNIANVEHTTTADISNLNFLIGELFAQAALHLCKKARISPRKIDLIGSHGQTVYHQGAPAPFLTAQRHTSTLQIGEPSVIAERTGIPVIADFRVADVAAGGQGAPLVPFVDYLLYAHPTIARIPLNLGGIANVSVIPPHAQPTQVLAFDTGPGNMIVDALVAHFTRGRESFDRNAQRARRGTTHPALMQELLHHRYFSLAPPKTAGREQFGAPYVEQLLARARKLRIAPNDLIRTATLLTPLSIAAAFHQFMLPHLRTSKPSAAHSRALEASASIRSRRSPAASASRTQSARALRVPLHIHLVIAGGGAHNPLIRAQLEAALAAAQPASAPVGADLRVRPLSAHPLSVRPQHARPRRADSPAHAATFEHHVQIVTSRSLGVPEDAKEAFAFALLAYESWHRRPANLPSATGARHPAILGKLCLPHR